MGQPCSFRHAVVTCLRSNICSLSKFLWIICSLKVPSNAISCPHLVPTSYCQRRCCMPTSLSRPHLLTTSKWESPHDRGPTVCDQATTCHKLKNSVRATTVSLPHPGESFLHRLWLSTPLWYQGVEVRCHVYYLVYVDPLSRPEESPLPVP